MALALNSSCRIADLAIFSIFKFNIERNVVCKNLGAFSLFNQKQGAAIDEGNQA
jgi:hypothetical protein